MLPSGLSWPSATRYSAASLAAFARAAFFDGKGAAEDPKGWSGREGMVHVALYEDPRE